MCDVTDNGLYQLPFFCFVVDRSIQDNQQTSRHKIARLSLIVLCLKTGTEEKIDLSSRQGSY